MKIATWNVNSVRTRLEQIINWLTENYVDVLCLQETKVIDHDFPRIAFESLGYYPYISGQKSYNGVALISRQPLTDVNIGFGSILPDLASSWDEQKRVISGIFEGVRIVNLYVPNGSSIGSEKYEYKLSWLKILREYLQTLLLLNPDISLCGDFNIALEDIDINSQVKIANHIMASEQERQALKDVISLGFADAFRKFNSAGENYSWWDYRTAAFKRNLGWRIDHHYLTPSLYERAQSCIIDIEPRKLVQPSDHTPVIVEF
ncbi:exodeoxyribonuclease III [Aphanizomenon flos-aquae NRERC-008]|jgi:exodeoxyribonuclease-3|uniref:Exodeoxyribonuclease III n=1 Tax=Aphanizomenon flos-aquae FACHB-1249 TaxID=2692889 RepID=A0ABR8IRV6_APHFL|nr:MULTISPECIES: exodeoxyribonuclease III [Aphanizomenon]MCE2907023.1 exodeoxyribonuclease III [Anabaena sp. CoA2_C59]MDJ0503636.1 exodeoxyribonuclease III [Nostocales cyanobacterium LE14-WE12]MBD2391167.1 exodeoxyribonuclease III [Aphanizomenon flos-aquae FACHB-1171]MBD2556506.1 exodeoxyribonuclease III [Aphanizomenon flos-aquae FACHB-1290]MBD2632117.1 exodeoxyribonuclease III [Aphanizomenon sp. FACHB-1399]